MTTLLLTGGAGAIGCHVVGHVMAKTDWKVTVVDSFEHGGDFNRIRTAMEGHDWARIKTVRMDLAKPINAVRDTWIGPADHIMHMAALSDVQASVDDPARVVHNNINSTLNLLDWASKRDHATFVQFSTDEVYGDVNPGQHRKPWDAHRPSNPYSASKAACEDIAYAYWRAGTVRLVLTNTTNNFGQMQGTSKFPTLVQKLIHEGTPVPVHVYDGKPGSRYYIHSRQVAEALVHILTQLPVDEHQRGQLDDPAKYHIAGDRAVDNLELAECIADLMGVPLDWEPVDCHALNPAHDIHYGIQPDGVPGWQASPTFKSDLADTVRWHMKHPEWLA